MATATSAVPASARNPAVGAQKRSTTPAPKASPNFNNVAAGTRAGGVGKTDGKAGKGLCAMSESVLRAGFLRKVYGLLAAQLLLTVTMTCFCMLTPVVRDIFLKLARSNSWLLQLAMAIPSLVSLLFLKTGAKDKYPTNYGLLFLFTAGISLEVSYVCSVYHALGYTHLILQAFGTTVAIFVSLTAYVLYSGKDFSYLGGFLMTALWGLVLVGFGAIFFPWLAHGLMYGFAGALIFCGYILYDTWRIQNKFRYDDYIGATIEIYLDIVNLFLYILRILMELQKNGESKKKRKSQ
jgi:hypothetical protein